MSNTGQELTELSSCRISVNSTDPDILRFVELFAAGVNSWIEAGKIVARRMKQNPNFIDEFAEACPDLPSELLVRFDQIGQRRIFPQYLILDCPAARKIVHLPYELQEKYFSTPVSVLVRNEGKWESLNMDIRNLTPDQVRQVFSKDGVRSDAAQRAYIESRGLKNSAVSDPNEVYRVAGNRLIVKKPSTFTVTQLAFILSQMSA